MLSMRNICKKYGKVVALDGLDVTIKKGEIFGFVGPNGAGKTTAMKIISGLLVPNSGQVMVAGVDAIKENQVLKEKIGYIPDFFGVYDNLKVIEYMEFFGSIYGIESKMARKLFLQLLDLVNLSDKAEEYVDHLSRGMKQKLCLARSLIHDPELLVLDEPASGLDPRARFETKEILKNLRAAGKTILISSHILPELSQMCTNIGIIDKGNMVMTGTVDHILHKIISANPLVMKITKNQEKALTILKANPLADNIAIKHNNVSIIFKGNEEEEAKLLATFIEQGVMVSSFAREDGSLESLFMQITAKEEVEFR